MMFFVCLFLCFKKKIETSIMIVPVYFYCELHFYAIRQVTRITEAAL